MFQFNKAVPTEVDTDWTGIDKSEVSHKKLSVDIYSNEESILRDLSRLDFVNNTFLQSIPGVFSLTLNK